MLQEKAKRDLSARTAWEMFDDEGYTTLDDLLDREYVREDLLPAARRNFEEAFRVMKENGWTSCRGQKVGEEEGEDVGKNSAKFSLGERGL